jgi:16S rRNA (cytosine967-C5)-methyltransferase
VLRGATRQRSELIAGADAQPLFVRTSHPEFLVERWQQHFGGEHAEALCRWNNLPAPMYARINRLRIEGDEFLRRYPTARSLGRGSEFAQFEALPIAAVRHGHCYVQDPSTSIACQLLDPKPGDKVFDACAAPGGKTGYVAQLMQNHGTIVACDRDKERLEILKENMSTLGVHIALIFQHDWTRGHLPEIASLAPFDRILLDAPCSNTGVMRRRVDVKWRLQAADFHRMQQQQIRILRLLVPLLKTNGVLVYSTCSLEADENRDVVHRILSDMPVLRLEAEKSSFPFRDNFDGAYAAKLIRTA